MYFGKVKTLGKSVLSSSPGEGGSYSSESEHCRKNGARIKVVCFEEEITETKARTPKTCPVFESW
jgi:hypothetical protein